MLFCSNANKKTNLFPVMFTLYKAHEPLEIEGYKLRGALYGDIRVR